MRYFLHIAYSGINYRGWQMQKGGVVSVQEIVEKNLSQVFKQPIFVIGCGRTDAQVHASQYFLHFQFVEQILTFLQIVKLKNGSSNQFFDHLLNFKNN